MKVLLVNGGPHKNGCVNTALEEVARTLNEEGIDTEIFWIGTKPIAGCIACKSCVKTGKCVFDDVVNEFVEKQKKLMALFSEVQYIMQEQQERSHHLWIEYFIQRLMEEKETDSYLNQQRQSFQQEELELQLHMTN